jgi:hypothetical protein
LAIHSLRIPSSFEHFPFLGIENGKRKFDTKPFFEGRITTMESLLDELPMPQ